MAKVYSWFLGKGDYAYIANPTDLSTYYVGAELTGDALQTVKDWAQNCSDTDYDRHFNNMVNYLNGHNYGVEFDSSETYRTMDTTCDNLRGPAGRGIVSFREFSADTINNATVYVVTYDDGTSSTFNVYNGKPGRDGRDGNDGADGDVGISTRTVFAYASGKDGEPARPVGGSWNYLDGKIEYPDGWTADDKVPGPVFMSSRTFASNPDAQDKEWSYPVQISGENGTPGADGTSIEFIYQRFSSPEVEKPDTSELPSPNENDYIPTGWKDSPEGVDEDNKVEYVSTRKKDKTTGVWGPWSTATIWSQYGTNGQDGDGIQYIYLRNKGVKPDNPTPLGYNDNESEFYADYQNKENEWLPTGEYYNIDVPSQKIVITDDNKWTDDPLGVTEEFQYEWVAQRKYRKGSGDTEQMWQAFSSPTLWAKYGESGSNGTSVRTMYCCTDSTGDEPAVDRTNLLAPGGDWQAGFPEDYVNGENVVWGITAVIYGHNNTFVDPEKGWEGPFLVTGTKGIDGTPMDYNTIAFCYAPKDYPPVAPNLNVEQDNLGSSLDGLGIYRQWYDFPDTTNVGLDGEEVDGLIMRWYQCAGTVDSVQGIVFKWGAVVPNSPMDGETLPGKYMEFRFAVTPAGYNNEPELVSIDSATGKPIRYPELRINNKQVGWYTTSNEGLPKMDTGCTMWQIYTWIDGSLNEVVYNDKEKHTWYGPQRVSGEKGDKGDMGPIGKRGVTGLPGATVNPMYCLGNEDEPYGTDEWMHFEGMTYGKLKENFTTWYEVPPTASVIKVSSQEEFDSKLNATNAGRLVQWYEATTENISGTSMNVVTKDTCYLISKDGSYSVIEPERIKKNEEGQVLVYVWCIQGNDVWKKGEYDEDTDGDKVIHEKVGIEWCEPFRMQGVSGLRGISGSRGQVVYPMGIYNPNEVYITTEDKAPYVYDASDGLFYVLNVVDDPWVGKFPDAPEDYTGETPYYQTIQYQTGFDENGNPTYAYKYEVNGQFLTHDQQGDWPANNYANKTNNDQAPAWVRFESFEALYTNVGIIENGMIGSAVYNNEFMFSQQGIDRDGNATDYAAQAKKAYDSGFLSAYEYDSDGKNIEGKGFCNWKYRGTDNYIADRDVDPYEVKTAENEDYLGGTKEDFNIKTAPYGTPIHSFRPNVCINFKTGEMWTSAGKVNFDVDGSGHLLDENILWYFGNDNTPVFQIGKDGEKGIRMSGSSMTIGVLEDYKDEMEDNLEAINRKITAATETLSNTIDDYRDDLQQQVDKRADSYYQDNDPSINWQLTDSSQTATYADYRVGDLWFDTSDKKSYTFARGTRGTNSGKDSENNDLKSSYYWVESDVPATVYNAINQRSKIFIEEPYTPYYVGDIWFVHSDNYTGSSFYGGTTGITSGTCMVCVENNTEGVDFNPGHWGRRDRYADEAQLEAAQEELELMIGQLDDWDNDGLLNPTELKLLSEEYKTIKNEYPNITGQASTVGITSYTSYSDYTAAYSKVTGMTDSYYLNSAHATAGTKSDCVKIITGTTETTNWYGWYEEYYKRRQVLLKAISNKLNSDTTQVKTDLTTLIEDNVGVLQNQLDKKAETYYQDTDPKTGWEESEYSLHEGDMWYNTSTHKTYRWNGNEWKQQEIPSDVFDVIDGKSSIFVTKPETDHDGDGYYYRKNDMWFLEKDYTSSGELGSTAKQGSIWVAKNDSNEKVFTWNHWIKKGTELDNWIAGDFADELAEVQTQMDKKADTFYQANDPSSGSPSTSWLSSTTDATRLASNHIGDLWFDTDDKKSYTYTNSSANTVSAKAAASPTGYYWVESDVPKSVYDRTDGKSSIFVTKPETDHDGDGFLYKKGDMYLSGNTTSGGNGELMRSTTDCPSTSAFTASHWVKASKYTDDTKALQALNRMNVIADDNYVSPEEQKTLKEEKITITAEYPLITAQCQTYGITTNGVTGYDKYSAYKTGYNRAISALTYYTNSDNWGSNNSADTDYKCIEIKNQGTGTTASCFGNIADYYRVKQDVQNALISAAERKAQSGATATTKTYSDNMAKKLGYTDYETMKSATAASGQIITSGGYLNAGLIEAGAITTNHLAAGAITADMISGTVANIVSAEIGDLTVSKLNTTPSQDTTKGRIQIENNNIIVYEQGREDYEVLRISGVDLPILPQPISATTNMVNTSLFSHGRLTGTTSGVTNVSIGTFKTPSNSGFLYGIKNRGLGQVKYNRYSSSIDMKFAYGVYLGNTKKGTVSSGSVCTTQITSLSGTTSITNKGKYEGLSPNTTYTLKPEYIAYNSALNEGGQAGMTGAANETFDIYPVCNKLDVAANGIRYGLNDEAYFECLKDSSGKLSIIMQTSANYSVTVGDKKISITHNGITYNASADTTNNTLVFKKQ